MKYLVAFLVSLLGFSGMALAHDYDYEYSCSVVVETSRDATFGKRSKALDFCDRFGGDDYCKVRQVSYKKWKSQYFAKRKFSYTSYDSWADSRYGAVKAMDVYFGQKNLIHSDFRHNFWYVGCYGDPKKHDDDYDDGGDDDYPSDPY